jgi:integrase
MARIASPVVSERARATGRRTCAEFAVNTHAAELARKGVPVNVIQAQLGHASLAVTDRYIRHLAPEGVIESMRSRAWEL